MTTFSVKDVNLETITEIRDFSCSMVAIFFVQSQVFSGNRSFSSRRKSRKSFTLTIHRNLAKLVKSYLGVIVHLRLTVPSVMVLLRERYEE